MGEPKLTDQSWRRRHRVFASRILLMKGTNQNRLERAVKANRYRQVSKVRFRKLIRSAYHAGNSFPAAQSNPESGPFQNQANS
jgi:hypothetical protein